MNLLVDGRIARITLNRPERGNGITLDLPVELAQCVERADLDPAVHVIALAGNGKGFCGGYDLGIFGQGKVDHPCQQERSPWDPLVDYAVMKRFTEDFMSLWRCPKPTIAKVHGAAVAGGSDIALCCDLLVLKYSICLTLLVRTPDGVTFFIPTRPNARWP